MILLNNAVLGAPWIETGTYLGETTSFLGRHFPLVVTLEPSKIHFTYNQRKFRNIKTIEVINKSSEEAFSEVIKRFKGAINIYLDGHSSGDGTFCGVNKTPVRIELEELEKNLSRFHDILIAIDDFRVFGSYESIYPSNFFLVDFCERNNLSWTVEHDLFLCSRRKQK
jgi:hypothetical protein